jgi:two-component system sensor histidine kinase DegS
MKNACAALSARYLRALRAHLGKSNAGDGDHAQSFGRAVLADGLMTRDLAIMHEQALAVLASTPVLDGLLRNGARSRAGLFFKQALVPLEAAERATREANARLLRRNDTLRRHSAALLVGNQRLQREIVRRKAGEVVIRRGEERHRALLLESHSMQRKLRRLTRQIISAQEEERKQISRELHDEVVQTLVGINVELSALATGASSGLRALKAKIAHTQTLVENSVKEVHRFARELRPAVLDDLGLIPALHAYSKNLAARKKIKIRMTAFGGVEALGGTKRTVLFRVAQEALTNVARHANATEVGMTIREVSGAIRMEISDNGQAFHVEKTMGAKNPKRLGLIGMKERIEMVGGNLIIKSVSGEGTTVCAEIPFNPAKNKK